MKNRINLLLPKEKSLVDRIVYFALNYLRYILVITQICVIGVFFYRFQVDQQIIDLKDELQQKKEIVNVSAPLIQEAALTQRKVSAIKKILQDQTNLQAMIEYIFSRFPEALTLRQFKITGSSILLTGVSTDAVQIKQFLSRLQSEKRFGTVQLNSITKTLDGYSVSFILNNFH